MCGNDSYRPRVHTGSRRCCHWTALCDVAIGRVILQINESEAGSFFFAVVVRVDLINSMAHCLS
jgi:hypothetical protein